MVYEVTKFLEDHPGGDEVFLSVTVGEIDVSTIPKKKVCTPPKQPHYNQDKTSEFIIRLLQFLVPLAILGLAVGIRIYTRSS
ncbi:cytochrome b5 isoform B [Citrus sinensis]|uniref:Cytochrome b5 isoform B n=1 Tax=Citrus sinensis TaxID=2711 RepID=A0ACB8I1E8_CITSI|nr:cytochrome b5 isoform B [Citrus sinensis]